MDDQREVIAFLSDGASYGRPTVEVEQVKTHISLIFLVADRAYKLKRAVAFSYVDYSTIARREQCCKAELALNRRTAPALYLQVHTITRSPQGVLAFDGDGEIIDWVLKMRRFAAGDLLGELATAGKLTKPLIRDLTDIIAAFHGAAEPTPDQGGRQAMETTIAGNTQNLLRLCPPLKAPQVNELDAATRAKTAALGTLLDGRRAAGKVRRCHGDLHLGNVCLLDGRPTPFDCIEFSDALSCIDVLYDFGFLLMDLVERGLADLASISFNRYLDLTADNAGLPALALFMSVRAAVRAHVLAALVGQNPASAVAERAQSYLDLAVAMLKPARPRLIAIGGLSGVGKSTVAQAVAPTLQPAPGARVIRSDVVRKRLFGVAPETRLGPWAYGQQTTERVYDTLEEQARAALQAGYTAIADASFLRQEERVRIAACAQALGVPFCGIWLEAPRELLAARIGARQHDASDADAAVLSAQLLVDSGVIDWHRIDATSALDAQVAAIGRLLEL